MLKEATAITLGFGRESSVILHSEKIIFISSQLEQNKPTGPWLSHDGQDPILSKGVSEISSSSIEEFGEGKKKLILSEAKQFWHLSWIWPRSWHDGQVPMWKVGNWTGSSGFGKYIEVDGDGQWIHEVLAGPRKLQTGHSP